MTLRDGPAGVERSVSLPSASAWLEVVRTRVASVRSCSPQDCCFSHKKPTSQELGRVGGRRGVVGSLTYLYKFPRWCQETALFRPPPSETDVQLLLHPALQCQSLRSLSQTSYSRKLHSL